MSGPGCPRASPLPPSPPASWRRRGWWSPRGWATGRQGRGMSASPSPSPTRTWRRASPAWKSGGVDIKHRSVDINTREELVERVVLVAVGGKHQDGWTVESSLDELGQLVATAGGGGGGGGGEALSHPSPPPAE